MKRLNWPEMLKALKEATVDGKDQPGYRVIPGYEKADQQKVSIPRKPKIVARPDAREWKRYPSDFLRWMDGY